MLKNRFVGLDYFVRGEPSSVLHISHSKVEIATEGF
jgi:hypothetical protein